MCACSGAKVKSSWLPIYSPNIIPPSSNNAPSVKNAAETRGMVVPFREFPETKPIGAMAIWRGDNSSHRPEHPFKRCLQGRIGVGHGDGDAEIGEAGDAMAAHAARHDPGKVRQVRRNVERDAVIGHPVADAHADGGDLVLAAVAPRHPNADAVRAPLARDAELRQCADQPRL